MRRPSYLAGLIGSGVGPSLSPEMHEREGLRQGLRYTYKVLDLEPEHVDAEHLRSMLDAAALMGYDGLNITHPVKQTVVPLLDELEPDAAVIGAVNTVTFADGITRGHNTDVSGFRTAHREGLPHAAMDEVVLLGAGGAGTAVAHALCQLGVEQLRIFDPDSARADRLIASVRAGHERVKLSAVADGDLAAALATTSGLVNATPVGMADHPGLPLPAELLHPGTWVADIVYRPLLTQLVRAARARGCATLTGAGMAVHQAADSFALITGHTPDVASMAADFDALVAGELHDDRTENSSFHPPR